MPMSLTQSQIEKKLTNEDLDELLHLWWAEQGAEKRRDMDLMAAAIPFRRDATLRVLDLCCGPGDVGRAIRGRYPNSHIDCVDRDVFLISICIGMNRREGVPGQNVVRDLWDTNWHNGLEPEYDVVATANALHWLDARRVAQVSQDVFRLLRPAGLRKEDVRCWIHRVEVAAAEPLQPRELGTILGPSKRNSWLRSHEAVGLARFAVDRRHAGIRLG